MKYTQADFDALPTVNGYKQCPTGDYSAIRSFAYCKFGAYCQFGAYCEFAQDCKFATYCEFGSHCKFANYCQFATYCQFGGHCKFAVDCSFLGHKAKPGYPMLSIGGAGSENRTTYFFNLEPGVMVQSGCFIGTLAEFKHKVLQDCDTNSVKASQYLGFAAIVELTFQSC